MSVTSVLGTRVAHYTVGTTTKEITQLASVTIMTEKQTIGKGLTYDARSIITSLESLVGKTSSDTTNFTFKETSTFVESTNTWQHDHMVRGFVVFLTPRGYHTVNFRPFEGVVGGAWNVSGELNRQMNLYADGNLPNGNYVADYNCQNWIWVYANLNVSYNELEGE